MLSTSQLRSRAIREAEPAEPRRHNGGIADHTLRVRIDREPQERAASVLHAAGLGPDDAVRTLFVRIAEDGEPPYRLFPSGEAAVERHVLQYVGIPGQDHRARRRPAGFPRIQLAHGLESRLVRFRGIELSYWTESRLVH